MEELLPCVKLPPHLPHLLQSAGGLRSTCRSDSEMSLPPPQTQTLTHTRQKLPTYSVDTHNTCIPVQSQLRAESSPDPSRGLEPNHRPGQRSWMLMRGTLTMNEWWMVWFTMICPYMVCSRRVDQIWPIESKAWREKWVWWKGAKEREVREMENLMLTWFWIISGQYRSPKNAFFAPK